ncbi:IS110 family transposase [Microvirga sp. BSC39]|uniref:IS110 family transposase n=1 Tax=Microvirga sp. BSC39 TaxID=1549810 RepID=UPI0004E87616|nr:IS110 family transposase [Microvirga sp. BSC39]KFG69294.1 hypothetical protein JH26_10620 [Microvirga sp. BSC39]
MTQSSFSSAIATLGIDLGKNSFHLVGQDERGAIVLRLKLSRTQLTQRLANIPPCLIGMEACAGAWPGLVPRQESTGDRTIRGRISKRGNTYLRTLFVQAAHIVLVRRPHGARLGLWPWIETAGRRLHRNMLVIALANKLARIAWAVLAQGHAYQPRSASHAM